MHERLSVLVRGGGLIFRQLSQMDALVFGHVWDLPQWPGALQVHSLCTADAAPGGYFYT